VRQHGAKADIIVHVDAALKRRSSTVIHNSVVPCNDRSPNDRQP